MAASRRPLSGKKAQSGRRLTCRLRVTHPDPGGDAPLVVRAARARAWGALGSADGMNPSERQLGPSRVRRNSPLHSGRVSGSPSALPTRLSKTSPLTRPRACFAAFAARWSWDALADASAPPILTVHVVDGESGLQGVHGAIADSRKCRLAPAAQQA